jgi:DNA polymerase-3 subunit epsilon
LKDYLLFIDTETSGIPGRWDRPLADRLNWPYAIQVAWIICDLSGKEIKRANKYIYEKDIVITTESLKIHGISEGFVQKHGVRRKEVLRKLAHDIKKYDPLVVGHFLELDLQVLSADYLRAQLKNPFIHHSFFCTMLKSKKYVLNPSVGYLRLSQLYKHLFKIKPQELHNAERDAELTAECFFELKKRDEITIEDFQGQQAKFSQKLNFLNKEIL